jgi:hypothetical protein
MDAPVIIEDPRAPSSSLALVREAQTIEAEGKRLREAGTVS